MAAKQWTSILAEEAGRIAFVETTESIWPSQIVIEDPEGKILDVCHPPVGARVAVAEGQKVEVGQLLAYQPEVV